MHTFQFDELPWAHAKDDSWAPALTSIQKFLKPQRTLLIPVCSPFDSEVFVPKAGGSYDLRG